MKHLLLATLVFINLKVAAQSSEFNITPPSNEIANYFSFAKPGMNLSKGVLDLSIPLASIDAPGYTVPMTLSYDSRGIQVQDVSSRVGTNWNLYYGGFVGRRIIGRPDEMTTHGYQDAQFNVPQVIDANTNQTVKDHFGTGWWDSQPDEFSFSAGSYSGNFIVGPNMEIFQYPNSDVQITVTATFSEVTIVTPDGIKYEYDVTESVTTDDPQDDFDDVNTGNTGWFISTITLRDGSAITFDYDNLDYGYSNPKSQSKFFINNPLTIITYYDNNGNPHSFTTVSCPNNLSIDHNSNTTVSTQRIKTIKYKGQEIDFNYSTTDRDDLANDFALDDIEIKNDNSLLKSVKLVTSSYSGSLHKLRLDKLEFYDANSAFVNDYKMDYFTGNLPSRTSYSIDYWGYFNGESNQDYLPEYYQKIGANLFLHHVADKEADLAKTKIGTLQKITYPTGGHSEFDYELNTIGYNPNGIARSDTQFNETTAHANSVYYQPTNGSNPDVHTTTMIIDHKQIVTISYSINNEVNFYEDNYVNISAGIFTRDSDGSGDYAVEIDPGTYTVTSSSFGNDRSAHITVHYKEIESIGPYKIFGGLRVKSIKDFDAINTTAFNVKTYQYDFENNGDLVSMGKPLMLFNYFYPLETSVDEIQGSGYTIPCSYSGVTSFNNTQSGAQSIYYLKVKEVYGATGDLGSTEYSFSTATEYSSSSSTYPYPPVQTRTWQMGKLTMKKVLDNTGAVKSVDSYTYQVFDETEYSEPLWKVTKIYDSHFNLNFNAYCYVSYHYFTNSYLPVQQSSTTYLNGDEISVTTKYYYNNPATGLVNKTETTRSDKLVNTTYYKYPGDYGVPATYSGTDVQCLALKSMVYNEHLHTRIIESFSTVGEHSGINLAGITYLSTPILVNAKLTTWKIFNGLPEAETNFSFINHGMNFSSFTPSSYSAGSFAWDQNYELESKILAYNSSADPIDVKNKVNQRRTLFWDDNNNLVAIASNSVRGSTAYTSFETSDAGNWIYSGSVSAGTAITGKEYYTLSGGSIAYDFSNAGDYTLSYWSTGSVPLNLSAGTATEEGSYETVNGWTFHQYKLEGVTSSSMLSLMGTSDIDELRLYSAEGVMVSAYYEPLCGLATYCDANNYLTNVEYDSYQRKEGLSDHYGNLLNYFEYHFQTDIANGDLNYSKVEKILQEGKTISDVQGTQPTEYVAQTMIQYIDGLGRDIQDIGYKQSPQHRDVIVPHYYDEFGRALKMYQPFTKGFNYGQYVSNALSAQQSFYLSNGGVGIAASNYGYSESEFDNSPLQRKQTDASPGFDWRMGGYNVHYAYDVNLTNEVKKWTYDAANQTLSTTYYSAYSLYEFKTEDEDGHLLTTFKDNDGKVIYEVQDDGNSNQLKTCYSYNLLGQLVCVIPPKANEELGTNNSLSSDPDFVKKWCFRYEYNERGWLTAKAEPGKDWTYFVYDKLNRVAFTQDPLQQASEKISFVKYDELGREIESGEADLNSETIASLQTLLLTSSTPVFEIRSATSASHYSDYIAAALTYHFDRINYYDHYDFDNDGTPDVTLPGNEARSMGLVTGTKSYLSGNTTGVVQNYEMTVSYYDYKGEVIRTETTNFEGRTDNTDYTYNFDGNVTGSNREHEKQDASTLSIIYVYDFDHAGRPKKTSMSIDGQPMHTISNLYYNEIGQLRYKSINGKPVQMGNITAYYYQQTINYKYNSRGWLTAINGTDAIYDNSEKFWGEDIGYGLCYGTASPLGGQTTYNGNISWVAWKGKRDGIKRGYGYEYDGFDRLTDAHYKAVNGTTNTWVDEVDRYTVDNMAYDANGNIMSMKVQGIITDDPTPTYGTIDELSYTYDGNVLTAVNDAGTGVWAQSPDFRDNGSNTTNEYSFDANLNMTNDDNKGLSIDYNTLNLPTKFTKGIDNMKITYGGGANKLQEVITEGSVQTVQQYFGDIIYKYNELTLENEPYKILHPEGYWQWNPAGGDMGTGAWEDYYYIKDHLGNVRVVFYGKDFKPSIYQVTMEASVSEQGPYPLFNDVDQFKNAEKSYEGEFAAKIGNTVGPNIRIPVKNRDSLEIIVWYYYDEPNEERGGTPHPPSVHLPVTIGFKTLPSQQLTQDGKKGIKTAPKIVPSIGINLFDLFHKGNGHHGNTRGPDEDSIPDGYIKMMLQDSAGNTLQAWKIKANKGAGGWIKIGDSIGIHLLTDTNRVHQLYLAMQNDKNINIWFDTLRVKHLRVQLPIVQENHYYPYGNLISDICFDNDCNSRELYNTKEMHNQLKLDLYNYGARWYDPQVGRWTTSDPLSDMFPSQSQFNYCYNNPIKFIDQFGMSPTDWVRGIDNKMEYDPDVHNQEQAETTFGKEAEYIGETYHETTSRGTVDYRKDGSIWYSNQTDAYNRIWDNSINGYFKMREEAVGKSPFLIKFKYLFKTRNEELAIIIDNGVLVMPDYLNKDYSELETFGYSWKDGQLFDPLLNKNRSIIATIHTHPIPGDPGPSFNGDNFYFPANTPGKLYMTMGEKGGRVYSHYGYKGENNVYSLQTASWLKVESLLSGYDLRKFAKDNIRTK